MAKPSLKDYREPSRNTGDIVFPSAALLGIVAVYSLYLAFTMGAADLEASYAGFYLGPASLLGLLGLVGGMLSGGWKPIPDSRARRHRVTAALVGLGSLVFTFVVLG